MIHPSPGRHVMYGRGVELIPHTIHGIECCDCPNEAKWEVVERPNEDRWWSWYWCGQCDIGG